jgi:hypothetical protein
MSERTPAGRFAPGNTTASQGGQARAARLSATRRQAIARLGWQALVERHFDGDTARAADYIGRLGAWAAERLRRQPDLPAGVATPWATSWR